MKKTLKLMKRNFYERWFCAKIILKSVSMDVHRNDLKKVNISRIILDERLFSQKIILKFVTLGAHKDDKNK